MSQPATADSPLRAGSVEQGGLLQAGGSSRAAESNGGGSQAGGAGPRAVPPGLAQRTLSLQPIQAAEAAEQGSQ